MQLRDGQVSLSPSDLSAHLGCAHVTTLELRVARGELEKPPLVDEQALLLFRKGEEHERAYLQRLRDEGRRIAEISLEPDLDWKRAARETVEAMRAGVEVVYQGVLVGERWRGVADFLLRVETPSELGGWSYEALDTKLARHAKPAYILQLCFYSERLAAVQGRAPAQMHVLLGNLEQESFAPEEFGAYYRRVRSRLEEFVADPPATEPYPVSQCGLCRFRPLCEEWWEDVDHLSRVAGIHRRQIDRLATAGITTLAGLGRANGTPPGAMREDTYAKLRQQARLQLAARESGVDSVELLSPQPQSGLALLPDPSPGDLFFDFEGNPFWDHEGSLEYLWGITDAADAFTPIFASTRAEERAAFERFVDLVHERLAERPDLHVYHYASYEISALRRLMGRYGTREADLDDLLRRGVFVDLLKVVRGGLRASRPGYGLKEMEAFLPAFRREAEIKDGGTSIVAFEEWMVSRDGRILEQIAAYNREDCIATRLLRDWLLERRAEALARFGAFPLPEAVESKPTPPEKAARAELREALLATGDPAKALAGQLLDYHDRERKPVWWAFFDRVEQTPEELVEDAESIGLLDVVSGPEAVTRKSVSYELTYPPQEHKLRKGEGPYDPATRTGAGEILELDREARHLVLKRGPKLEDVPLPQALIPGRPYDTDDQEDALERIGRALLAGDGRYPAVESVLRRQPFPRPVQTTDLDEIKALVLGLDGRQLVIQGPPGSGKTWLSGRLIAYLIAQGKRVGVASTSHKAIHNLVDGVEDAAAESGLDFVGLKKASSGNPESYYESEHVESATKSDACVDCDLAAGTAWLFARVEHDRTLDYLFVDEAGQVSLADALAMGTAARNLVLVGDPQQLDQVLQGTHPDGSELSVLRHLLGDDATIPADRGLFLEQTFRLHPDVCGFISEEFYEGRLRPAEVAGARTTQLGAGLRYVPVEHDGCRQHAPAEVQEVRRLVARLQAAGIALEEILVVAPFNAQVNALQEVLPEGARVGTVDKFQGQEGRVAIYSMASSSGDDVPRGLDFLLSRNRFNVAVSRAQCLAFLVCSPRLLEVDARTIPHMRLANALCRFVELAQRMS
jgi:predicted RecB family nuclease